MTSILLRFRIPAIAVVMFVLNASRVFAQSGTPDGMWFDLTGIDLDTIPAKASNPAAFVNPTVYRALWLDEVLLDDVLQFAPIEDRADRDRFAKSGATLWLPMPDGTNIEFGFVESPIMEPELAEKFPEIKTYSGRSLGGGDLFVRFDRTPRGFHAIVLGGPQVYIDPYGKEGVYVSYDASEYPLDENQVGCNVEDSRAIDEAKGGGGLSQHGDMFRTYRLAVACSGEYANYHDATSQQTLNNAMAAVTTTVNRVQGIYETELAVGFTLVANNDLILFWDPATDAFNPTATVIDLMNQSQTTINAVIGPANFDIGHTLAVADLGGVADLGCVCGVNRKAKGVTTSLAPIGDPYDVDFVAHEIGHQFGGEHTFNSVKGGCKGNREKKSAYERGAGTTIMSYAGICRSDNVTDHAAPAFHSQSLAQIQDFLATTICGVTAPTGDSGPLVDAGADYTIPKQSPFKLTATGTDSDGDLITYSWEERDLGPSQQIKDPDNGKSPLFRSYYPKGEPFRIFPRLDIILSGKQYNNRYELLPSLARNMTFWVVGRDAHGGFGSDEMLLSVDSSSGPFKVTYPNTAVIITGGSKKRVKWDVARTNLSPVSASNVRIVLSLDGGQSFPIVLKDNTPNDGAEKVKFPNTGTLMGRVKVEAIGNIFFDISDKNFAIDGGFSVIGTWNDSGSTQAAPSRYTFHNASTFTWCFNPPNYDSCPYVNYAYTFEQVDDSEHPWLLTIPSVGVWYFEVIDNNTMDKYIRLGVAPDTFDVYQGTLTRQQ